MQKTNVRNSVFSGLFWKFAERFCAQGISFIVSIILARLLLPEVYGVVAIVMVFLNIAGIFTTGGFSMALIQKKDADDTDFSTMFYCSLAVSCLLYVLLWFAAPAIAAFYEIEALTKLLRVFSIWVIISSYNSIQHAYVSRHMIFKKFFFSTIIGTLISGVLGVYLAFNGAGVWALVVQFLSNHVIDSIVLTMTINWRPKLVFSLSSAKRLMGFGWKCLASSLIGALYTNLRSLLIGKVYTANDLAFYNKGKSFPDLIANNLSASVFSVLFPAIANVSDKLDEVRRMTKKMMKVSSYVIFPMMMGMAALADTMVKLLLTEKWMSCVPYLQLACLYSMFHTITDVNLQSINAIGRSDVVLKMEFIKKPVSILIILIALRFDVIAMGISLPLSSLFTMIVNMQPNKKLLGYGFAEQAKDLCPAIGLSALMAVCVFAVGRLSLPLLPLLLLQIAVGVGVYVLGSVATKNDSFRYMLEYVFSMLGRKRTK